MQQEIAVTSMSGKPPKSSVLKNYRGKVLKHHAALEKERRSHLLQELKQIGKAKKNEKTQA